jgi:hypothetical protein
VKFMVDESSRLVVRAWIPDDATADAAWFLIRRVAEEADRLEFLMTGQDRV